MIRQTLFAATLAAAFAAPALAQNANTSATPAPSRPRTSAPRTTTTTTTPAPDASGSQQETTPAPARPATAGGTRRQSAAEAAQARAVRSAFDSLIDGIRRADPKAVMEVYWNSPQLVLFNNNGTVTKTWEQVRQNRESLYARVSDVKLDVRDVQVRNLGPTGAVVSCLWEQSQTAGGQPERATGRLTIVFQKVGAAWKAVHAHTSPDRPDPSRLLPSERTNAAPTDPAAARP